MNNKIKYIAIVAAFFMFLCVPLSNVKADPITTISTVPPAITTPVPPATTTTTGDSGTSAGFSLNIFGKISDIFDSITNLPQKVMDSFNGMARDFAKASIESNFEQIQSQLDTFSVILTSDGYQGFFSIANTIRDKVRPIAYSLLALFFIIGFTKKTIYFDFVNKNEIIKTLLLFVLTKSFIDKSGDILNIILNFNRGLCKMVMKIGESKNTSFLNAFNTQLDHQLSVKQSIIDQLSFSLPFLLLTIFVGLLFLLCFVMINLRNIELGVLIAVSPIFFATLGSDVTNDVFKNFIKNFITVALQTLWMSVALVFLMSGYMEGVASQGMGVFGYVIGIITLSIYCVKAPSSVKEAIGGAGGQSFSLSSVAMLMR